MRETFHFVDDIVDDIVHGCGRWEQCGEGGAHCCAHDEKRLRDDAGEGSEDVT